MPPPLAPVPPAPDALDPEARLRHWPLVVALLERSGHHPARRPGETADEQENRLGTRLMALFRDTRRKDAFEALYALARPAVLAWIRGLLSRGRAHLDPGELLQDTFVNVYRYPSGFREEHAGSFRVWVRTIAGNLVRRASVPRGRLSFQEFPEGLQEPEDRGPDPVLRALTREEEERLTRTWMLFLAHYGEAWRDLAQRDRRTLHLVEVEGLSYDEAGAILGVGRSNMKMIVFRARKRLARRIRQAMNAAIFAPLGERVAG